MDAAPLVRVRALANGGEGVATLEDGRAVFVAGALPGEDVRIELVEQRKRYARARLLEVVVASPDRRAAPCRWHRAGCGGCDLMHAAVPAQRAAKVQLAREALQRLGGLADPVVLPGPELPTEAVRTTVRVAVLGGRAAFRQRASHELVAVADCLVAHPALVELIAEGRFGGAEEATLRVGAATGERLVVVSPDARGVRLPADVVVVGADALAAGRPGRAAHVHEVVDGRRWRISAASFFQAGPVAAQALVDAVRQAIGDAPPAPASGRPRALDAYCGVGLLSAALPAGAAVVAVESSASSVADARHNLADLEVEVVQGRVERWRPQPVDLVVADPSRRGLGRPAAEVLAATGAATVVLVSCDLAALGRDSADLVALGYDHAGSTVLDLFPHTSHAEVVTRFQLR